MTIREARLKLHYTRQAESPMTYTGQLESPMTIGEPDAIMGKAVEGEAEESPIYDPNCQIFHLNFIRDSFKSVIHKVMYD